MADCIKKGTEVQALDHDTGLWTRATVVDVDPRTRQAFISYNGWASQWNRWIKIGSIKEEAVGVLDQLGEVRFRSICKKGHLERKNCLPGPRHFDPTSEQTKTVMLLEWLDEGGELSDHVLQSMSSLRIVTQGDSFIRTLEILVWKVYSEWNAKGYLRLPIAEKDFPRSQEIGTLSTSLAQKLRKGDKVLFRTGTSADEGTVRTNDPYLRCVTLLDDCQKQYEDLVTKDWMKKRQMTNQYNTVKRETRTSKSSSKRKSAKAIGIQVIGIGRGSLTRHHQTSPPHSSLVHPSPPQSSSLVQPSPPQSSSPLEQPSPPQSSPLEQPSPPQSSPLEQPSPPQSSPLELPSTPQSSPFVQPSPPQWASLAQPSPAQASLQQSPPQSEQKQATSSNDVVIAICTPSPS